MRILVVRSNPRKRGRTQHFTNLFVQGAQAAGAEVRDIDLMEKTIAPCLGCYHCWVVTPGQCVHHDDMQELLREFVAADVIVCATPLYYYSLSSRMQMFLERTLPLTAAGLDTTAGGLSRNKTRYPEHWQGKKLIFLAVGAFREVENFKPFQDTCRLIAEGLAMELGGVLIRPEAHLTGFSRAKPKGIKALETAFVDAGAEAARTGRLSEQVRRKAALYLAPDDASFRNYCDVYWADAQAMGAGAVDSEALVTKVSKDARILMPFMVSSVDPVATARTKAVLQFDFTEPDAHYGVVIDSGTARLTHGQTAAPDLRVSCTAEVWADIARGDLDPRAALREGRVTITGDRSLFARLARFFPVVG